jgi:hypothetical protein
VPADVPGQPLVAYPHRVGRRSRRWPADTTVAGPILAGFRAGVGNLPRGLYVIDGLYRLVITADGHLTLTLGHPDNVCEHIE